MDHFLICENPGCRFVVDVYIEGKTAEHQPFVLSACPECGSKWSSICPFSGRALIVQWSRGLPHCLCCNRKLLANDGGLAALTSRPIETLSALACKKG